MSDSNPWAAIVIPLLTAALTVAATSCQTRMQLEQVERTRFLDGAQQTAQETSTLLDEGYQALAKLLAATKDQGWEDLHATAWGEYIAFHRRWRRQVVAQHFKLTRYFGKDLADQLIHVDEIDLRPLENVALPSPCAPPGGPEHFDIVKLASQIECSTRTIGVLNDVAAKALMDNAHTRFFDDMNAVRTASDFAWELLKEYDRGSVRYLRELNRRLTDVGSPEVKVVQRRP